MRNIFYLNVADRGQLGEWDHYPTDEEMRQALIELYRSGTSLGKNPSVFEVVKKNRFYQGVDLKKEIG